MKVSAEHEIRLGYVVRPLESLADKQAYRLLFYRVFRPNFNEATERYSHLAANDAARVNLEEKWFGIKDGDRVVAGASVKLQDHVALLGDLAVDPDYKNLGLARQLLARRISWAKEQKCRRVISEIRSTNYAALASAFKSGLRLTAVGEIDTIDEPIFILTKDLFEAESSDGLFKSTNIINTFKN